jgi:hypothetical protein
MVDPGNGANLGFETNLWKLADALRSHMDAAESKHFVLGLIFLKFLFDVFEAYYANLEADRKGGADPEDLDGYCEINIFCEPQEDHRPLFKADAGQPKISRVVDDARLAIEPDNPSLKGVLPKVYPYRSLDKQRLGLGESGQILLRAGHVTDAQIHVDGVERFDAELADKLQARMSFIHFNLHQFPELFCQQLLPRSSVVHDAVLVISTLTLTYELYLFSDRRFQQRTAHCRTTNFAQ